MATDSIAMAPRWQAFSDWLLDGLFPVQCLGCSAAASTAKGFCGDCYAQLVEHPRIELHGLPLRAPYRYDGPLAEAIVRLKYGDRSDFASRLVRACFAPESPSDLDFAQLVPVPMHPERLCARGYNQAALLARALGRRWRRPVAYLWLERTRLNSRQVGLDKAARVNNAQGAFAATRACSAGTRVVLVDDVVTTGSTLQSCVQALAAAGVEVVTAVALARADRVPEVPEKTTPEDGMGGLGL